MDYKLTAERCRKGDREGQMLFYDIFHLKIYNSSYRILLDEFEAEDVMQQTILKVLTRPELIKDDLHAMEAFLRRMAINMALDILRKKKIEVVELSEKYDRHHEEEQEAELLFQPEQIVKQIQSMSKSYRVILLLKLIDGLDYEEIAQVLAISESSARAQYSRARQKLSQTLRQNC